MKKRLLPFALFFLISSSIHAQWAFQAENLLPPNYSVMNLSIVNDQVVWAVAIDFNQWAPSTATHVPWVLRTTNGGADWSAEEFPQATGKLTYGIVGLDDSTALLSTTNFSDTDELFKTTDAGNSWSIVDDGLAAGGRLMFFDETEGVSVNPYMNAIARTNNGGDSWTTLASGVDYPSFPNNDELLNIHTNWDIFGDTLWVGTNKGKLYKSTDRGQNWDVEYETNNAFISIAFLDSKNGLATVGNFLNPPLKLMRTTDGGKHWDEISNAFNLSEVFAVPCTNTFIGTSFFDNSTAWSSGLGESWEPLGNTPNNLRIFAPTFSSPETGWAAFVVEGGFNYAVLKWDGGILNGRTYVNHAATGNNDGTSWVDAYTDLQDALAAAEAGDEIWVAEGTYLPGSDPTSTFLIDKDLKLYGGFAGTECNLSERDIVAYPTILSGDLDSNDTPGEFFMDRDDNVESVMEITDNVSNSTVIDGFTIKGGHANGTSEGTTEYGGGIFSQGAPVIRNCLFEQNFVRRRGTGLFLQGTDASGALVEDCLFRDNYQYHPDTMGVGGAIYVIDAPGNGIHVRRCSFDANNGFMAGGISSVRSSLYVDSCSFTNNTSLFQGGGIRFRGDADNTELSVRNSLFDGNSSAFGGGANALAGGNNTQIEFYNNTFTNNASLDPNVSGWGAAGGGLNLSNLGEQNTFQVTHCSFTNNSADYSGGGLVVFAGDESGNSSAVIDDCSFSNNTAFSGSGLASELGGNGMQVDLKNAAFTNNHTIGDFATAWIWTFTNSNAPPEKVVVDSCIFENNTSVYTGGLDIGSGTDSGPYDFTISNTSFLNNQTDYCGGFDIWGDEGSRPTFHIENCVVAGNTADKRGGGFWVLTSSSDFKATMDRCSIINNSSPQGAAITTFLTALNSFNFPEGAEINISNSLISGNSGSAAIEVDSFPGFQLTNCTVVDNPFGAIQLSDQSGLILQNTILHNNGTTEFEALTTDVTVTSNGGNLIGDGSLVDYALTYDLQDTDPLLDSDYYPIAPNSPAIDQGVDLGNLSEFDLDGNSRENGCVDIGAYESDVIVSTDCITSTDEAAVVELVLSPNPASDFLNIQLPENITKPNEISLFDTQGKLVRLLVLTHSGQVDVHNLPSGMYVLKAVDEEQVYVGRFVKQ